MFKVYIKYGTNDPIVYYNAKTEKQAYAIRSRFLSENSGFQCWVSIPDEQNILLERSEQF